MRWAGASSLTMSAASACANARSRSTASPAKRRERRGSLLEPEMDGHVDGAGHRPATLHRRREAPLLDGFERGSVEHVMPAAGEHRDTQRGAGGRDIDA